MKSTVKTILLIVSFAIDGLVHHEFISRGQSVNSQFHKVILQRLSDTVHRHQQLDSTT